MTVFLKLHIYLVFKWRTLEGDYSGVFGPILLKFCVCIVLVPVYYHTKFYHDRTKDAWVIAVFVGDGNVKASGKKRKLDENAHFQAPNWEVRRGLGIILNYIKKFLNYLYFVVHMSNKCPKCILFNFFRFLWKKGDFGPFFG